MSTSSKGPVEKGLSLDFLDAKPDAVFPPKKRKTVKKKVDKKCANDDKSFVPLILLHFKSRTFKFFKFPMS